MKYLHLVWAALFRRKTRTILTLVSIIAAFLLFGLLDAVRASFEEAGQSVLLLMLGGVLGLGLASLLVPFVSAGSAGSGGMLNLPTVGASSWALGVGLMVLFGVMVGVVPAMSAMRLNIVDALRR